MSVEFIDTLLSRGHNLEYCVFDTMELIRYLVVSVPKECWIIGKRM